MAKKFVRTITDTKLKGKDIEPLITNKQNDLLSDEHDVYVRNKDYYHCLTNAIQKIESKNDSIIVSKKDKNTVVLEYTGDGGGTGEVIPVTIESLSKYIDVEEIEENHFQLSTEQLEIELEEIRKLIENMGNGEEPEFIGNVPGYDFEYITDNNEVLNATSDVTGNVYLDKYSNYTSKVGLIEIDGNSSADKMNLRNITEIKDLKPLTVFNITYRIKNNSNSDIKLRIQDLAGSGILNEKIKDENGITYQNDIILPNLSVKEVKTTYYINEKGNVLFIYVKEIE